MFYVRDLGDNLPAFVNELLRKLWSWAPLSRLSPKAKALADATARLKKGRLTGGHIMRTTQKRNFKRFK